MTDQQRKFYRAAVVPVAVQVLELGELDRETKCAAHERLKQLFLPNAVDKSTGEVLDHPISTTGLSAVETSNYFENIRDLFDEAGYEFPSPSAVLDPQKYSGDFSPRRITVPGQEASCR